MEYGYIIKLSSNSYYREIQLPVNSQILNIGMDTDCDVRLYKENFFEVFKLSFRKSDKGWTVSCTDNVYLDTGEVIKLSTKELSHGDTISVKYQSSNKEIFRIDFLFDFDNEKKNYNRKIDISSADTISIGSSMSNNIALDSKYTMRDQVILRQGKGVAAIKINSTTYGVYHNGKLAEDNEIIADGDFISIGNFSFYYKNRCIYTEMSDQLSVNGLPYTDSFSKYEYPKFRRNSRIKTVLDDEEIEILDPPAKPQKPQNNIIMRLLPAIGMLAASGIMAFMGGMMIIFSAISGALAIITTIVGVVQNKKDFKKKTKERIVKYENYIENKREEIELFRLQEKKDLEDIYISQSKEQKLLDDFSADLFDRTREDEDFLCVRLGYGDVEAAKKINYKKQEKLEIEDNLQDKPKEIYEEYRYLKDAPVVCDFKKNNAIGIIGNPKYRFSILKNIVVDICARHYHSDVKMVFVASKEHKKHIYWLRMLPEVYNEELGIRNIACNDESKNIIFEYLYKELTAREQNKTYENNIVVVMYDEYGFQNHPISKFVDNANELGVTFVFFGNDKAEVPLGCGAIVDVKSENTATLISTEDKNASIDFTYPAISYRQAEDIVNMLAPVYTEEVSLEGTLTKNISLFELLNIIAVDDLNLGKRWAQAQVFKSMSAPIGVSKSGVVSLDLHDKFHGPHGLVAGTTGSGKSEILQTYILSMATLFHPYEVAFVIIDFKGGGMVNQFKTLPHLLGAITNIDGKEINRSLKSIKAELQKRQRLFAEADVNHIDKYIRKYKSSEVTEPLPHLIIVVDEFAELKAEQPEFMKELISAARIGRSLGVHLILATQKPSGQVNEQIWSNSRFKLCLKVQSQEDSNEVLKSPLAAEIKEPGRAYLQVGNNEIFELFQSAYSGAPEKTDDSNVKEFSVIALTDTGKRVPVYVQKKKSQSEGNLTQLDAIVKYVNGYCRRSGVRKLPDICLPPLEEYIEYPFAGEITGSESDYRIMADIGIYDDSDRQYQGSYAVDIGSQNMMIIGSAQTGKTNVLQCIIRSVAEKYTPDEVSIYIIDFASMILKNFETLNHVGGVVTASEDEKLKNLMKMLYREIEVRKERMLSVGVSSFAAYREAGLTDLPQIILMIDNLTALKELYFQEDDELLNLCREGLSVGISVIIANAQTAGIGYKYLSNFASRIAMFCNDAGEYSSLFDHCRERIEDIKGRCLIEIDKEHLECQSYIAFSGEKEIERVNKIKAFIENVNGKYEESRARIIPVIPPYLGYEYVVSNYRGHMRKKYQLVVGLNYDTVSPLTLDFASLGVLGVTGREKSGKHNFVKYIVQMLDDMYPGSTQICIVDSVHKKLASLKNDANVVAYTMAHDAAVDIICQIEKELRGRYEQLISGNDNLVAESPLIVFIVDNMDALTAISEDQTAMTAYRNILSRYKNLNICIIASSFENVNVPYGAPEVIRSIKDLQHFMYFDDVANMKIFDFPLSVMRTFKKPIEMGDGYYIKENECVKVKTAKAVK